MTLDELEALCRKATLGEREFVRTHGGRKARVVLMAAPYVGIYNVNCGVNQTANGELAAACSPDYILGLIGVARAAGTVNEAFARAGTNGITIDFGPVSDALKALNTPETPNE